MPSRGRYAMHFPGLIFSLALFVPKKCLGVFRSARVCRRGCPVACR